MLIEKLLNEGWASDEKEALALVMTGNVLVNDYPAASTKEKVTTDSVIRIRGKNNTRYVTRAGLKLEKGLNYFGISAQGKTCLDIGAAEGGFTDCLLAFGAAKVYSVDVAYGIFDWSLRNNEKVVVLERTNARYLDEKLIPEPIDLLVSDVSFISLTKILPPAIKLLKPEGVFVVLYKPQFELAPEYLGKNGNVENPDYIFAGIKDLSEFLEKKGIFIRKIIESPIRGSNGNVEYLLLGEREEFI
ncbi:MAG: TlyA family RNA methyltransferase [Lachnospiraceae bacterium]|nr:TlyA family RNA methyltransferase [Lachnospiraceae bacterium]